jgi:hypothetical protein
MKRKWPYLAALLVVLLLILKILTSPLMQVGHQRQKQFDETYSRFSNAILARDFATAYSIGDPDFREVTSEKDFIDQQQEIEARLGPLESSKILNFKIYGHGNSLEWIAQIREARRYKNGNFNIIYEFHFEDDRWQLSGYRPDE